MRWSDNINISLGNWIEFYRNSYHRTDPAQKALIGGDLTLMDEYMGIMLQATLLEGLLYVVCVGPETEERIVSTGSFFANGKFLFDRYSKMGFLFFVDLKLKWVIVSNSEH